MNLTHGYPLVVAPFFLGRQNQLDDFSLQVSQIGCRIASEAPACGTVASPARWTWKHRPSCSLSGIGESRRAEPWAIFLGSRRGKVNNEGHGSLLVASRSRGNEPSYSLRSL